MSNVVTGLSSDGNATQLRSALSAAGFPVDTLQIINADDSVAPVSGGLIGTELFTGDHGAEVPGLSTPAGLGGSSATFFRREGLDDRLAELRIPESEADNYREALERGKYLFAYFAKPETVEKVTSAFRESGLLNVRTF